MEFKKTFNIHNIKEQFSELFPFLKIEFYTNEHKKEEGSSITDQLNEATLLSEINPGMIETEVMVDPDMTVASFEKLMREKFDFNVQVFRKSNDLWLQTSATDNWTLDKQNGKGGRSTLDYDIDPVNISDFDLD